MLSFSEFSLFLEKETLLFFVSRLLFLGDLVEKIKFIIFRSIHNSVAAKKEMP